MNSDLKLLFLEKSEKCLPIESTFFRWHGIAFRYLRLYVCMTIMYCVYRHLRLLPKGFFVIKKSPCFCVIVYSKSILIKITIRTLTSFSNQDSLAIIIVELGVHTKCIYKVNCPLDLKILSILLYLVS